MECFVRASDLVPEDEVYLGNIANTAEGANWIQWSDKVRLKIQMLDAVKARSLAAPRVALLREELQSKQVELEKLKKQKGLFSDGKIKSTEQRIRGLMEDINWCEQVMAYELPKAP